MPPLRLAALPFALFPALVAPIAAAQEIGPWNAQQTDQTAKTLSTINVKGEKPCDWCKYVAAKLKHQMSEVSGTEITG